MRGKFSLESSRKGSVCRVRSLEYIYRVYCSLSLSPKNPFLTIDESSIDFFFWFLVPIPPPLSLLLVPVSSLKPDRPHTFGQYKNFLDSYSGQSYFPGNRFWSDVFKNGVISGRQKCFFLLLSIESLEKKLLPKKSFLPHVCLIFEDSRIWDHEDEFEETCGM